MERGCFHGGSFWRAAGDGFLELSGCARVVNADVLDAWFPPAPHVIEAVSSHLEWVSRTSPPTHAEGLVEAIGPSRNLRPDKILAGPGSSALMYLALGQWLVPSSRVLLIEPSYGEYAHYANQVVGCLVDTITTRPQSGFQLDLDQWIGKVSSSNYDLAVLVNPNNPTGAIISQADIRRALCSVPERTRVLIDEAYIDYTGVPSCESLVADFPNMYVLKSLSKCFGLSGLRVAYLAGQQVGALRKFVPPWWVSLPAQIAAVEAVRCREYYADRYAETVELREWLRKGLEMLAFECYGQANWVLSRIPEGAEGAHELVARLEEREVFIRNAGKTAPSLGDRWIRVAVKEQWMQQLLVNEIESALRLPAGSPAS